MQEQNRIPLNQNVEKFYYPQKRLENVYFLQISVHSDMKSTNEIVSEQKTPESIHSWSSRFWKPIANVSFKVQYEKTSI